LPTRGMERTFDDVRVYMCLADNDAFLSNSGVFILERRE